MPLLVAGRYSTNSIDDRSTLGMPYAYKSLGLSPNTLWGKFLIPYNPSISSQIIHLSTPPNIVPATQVERAASTRSRENLSS